MILHNLTTYQGANSYFYPYKVIDSKYRYNRFKSIERIIAKKLKAQENWLKNNCKKVG